LNNAQLATDGDNLNISTATSGGYYARFDLYGLDLDYYPFLSFSLVDSSTTISIGVKGLDAGASYVTVQGYATLSAGVYRYNLVGAGVSDYDSGVMIYVRGGDTGWTEYEYFKLYSIANFTVTQSESCTTADIAYVDASDNLVFERATTHWMVLETPYTNITTASYPVWNITKSGTLGFGIRTRGGPSDAWGTAVYGTTRGATTELISVFDPFIIMIQIHSQSVVGVCTISEIKFIEEITMEFNIFSELFLSTELWGYFGPLGLVIIGYLLTKKEKNLGIFMVIVDSLIIAQYFALVDATPYYWWHIIILLLGVVLCAFQSMDR